MTDDTETRELGDRPARQKTESSSRLINRRSFVKTASSIAAFGGIVAGGDTVAAANHRGQPSKGTTRLLEVRLDHEGAPPWPRRNYDPIVPRVNTESKTLTIADPPGKNVSERVAQNDYVVQNEQVQESPTSVYGRSRNTVQLGPLAGLATKEEYNEPRVKINPRGRGKFGIEVEGSTTSVGVSEEMKVKLPERPVVTFRPSSHEERVVSLAPIITVRNFGELQVKSLQLQEVAR